MAGPVGRTRTLDRVSHGIEFSSVLGNLPWICQHAFDASANRMLKILFPLGNPRLSASHLYFLIGNGNRKNMMALGEGLRHDVGNGSHVEV